MSGSIEFQIGTEEYPSTPPAPNVEMGEPKKVTLSTLLGGRAAIDYVVDDVFDRVMNDRSLSTFFMCFGGFPYIKTQYCNMLKQMAEQYSAADMIEFQEDFVDANEALFALGVDKKHFDVVIGHFVITLESLGVTRPYIIECVRVIMPLRQAVAHGAAQARERQAFARKTLNAA